jgi:uncharacterized protein (DUF697 family)
MAGWKDLPNIWDNIKEIDLRPLRESALQGLRVALVGKPGCGMDELAGHMRRDPRRPDVETSSPLLLLSLEQAGQAAGADLVILVLLASDGDDAAERKLVRGWADSGGRLLVVINRPAAEGAGESGGKGLPVDYWKAWGGRQVLVGPLDNRDFIMDEFVPTVMELVPQRHLALGRNFPLFRVRIARDLINDTCFSNAAYALSTGLAEVVPVLDLPLNLADTVVLTKTQAFLVYKLGLELGFSTRWQDYMTEFGGVLGGGFIWRQVARQLIGLIPAWGIIPKVAVSYAGTYVVGNVVLQWYLTGRHVDNRQVRQLYAQAFAHGKLLAQNMIKKLPRPAPKARPAKALPAPRLAPRKKQVCPQCGKTSARDAQFCQYCGTPFESG